MKRNIYAIKRHAQGQWLSIIAALSPQLSEACQRPGQHVKCPCHGSRDGFRMFQDAAESGGGYCNRTGAKSNGFALLMWANGWNFRQTINAVSSYLGMSEGDSPSLIPTQMPMHKPAKDWSVERQRLQAIWEATEPDDGRIRQYQESRGLAVDVPPTLRLHPSLRYYHEDPNGLYPAMVARIQREGETVGLHLSYLDPGGLGKAPVSKPRKIRKCVESISGGAIQLFEPKPNQPLALAEGIESALAIRELTGFPVWACGNSTLLSRAEIPEVIQDVYIGADKDRSGAGEVAAQALAQRLWEGRGREAIISLPPLEIPENQKSVDWLDYVAQAQEVVHG